MAYLVTQGPRQSHEINVNYKHLIRFMWAFSLNQILHQLNESILRFPILWRHKYPTNRIFMTIKRVHRGTISWFQTTTFISMPLITHIWLYKKIFYGRKSFRFQQKQKIRFFILIQKIEWHVWGSLQDWRGLEQLRPVCEAAKLTHKSFHWHPFPEWDWQVAKTTFCQKDLNSFADWVDWKAIYFDPLRINWKIASLDIKSFGWKTLSDIVQSNQVY